MSLSQDKYDSIQKLVNNKEIPKAIDKNVRDTVVLVAPLVNKNTVMAFNKTVDWLSVPVENLQITVCDIMEYLLSALEDAKNAVKNEKQEKEKINQLYNKTVDSYNYIKNEYVGLQAYHKKEAQISEPPQEEIPTIQEPLETKFDILDI